jgi:hypothetical protein
MVYSLVMLIALVVTIAGTRRTPLIATRIGAIAVVTAVGALTVAELTGNLLLFYFAALAAPFGGLILLVRAVDSVRIASCGNRRA